HCSSSHFPTRRSSDLGREQRLHRLGTGLVRRQGRAVEQQGKAAIGKDAVVLEVLRDKSLGGSGHGALLRPDPRPRSATASSFPADRKSTRLNSSHVKI